MRQGDIWEINLSPTVGAEIRKKRPGVIINDEAIGILPLKVIVPITEWKERFQGAAWLVRVEPDDKNGLMKTSAVDAFQIRSVSTKRLLKKVGVLSPAVLNEIKTAIKAVIDAAD